MMNDGLWDASDAVWDQTHEPVVSEYESLKTFDVAVVAQHVCHHVASRVVIGSECVACMQKLHLCC